MKYRPFPLGYPDVLTRETLLVDAGGGLPWTAPAHNPYKGFLLCRVLPPRSAVLGERKPVLPMRTSAGKDQRLVFTLCRKCANLCAQQHHPCTHSARERSWIAAYSHFELNKALSVGYRVTELYEVPYFFRDTVEHIRFGTMPNGQHRAASRALAFSLPTSICGFNSRPRQPDGRRGA